jgi:hypothetical protein
MLQPVCPNCRVEISYVLPRGLVNNGRDTNIIGCQIIVNNQEHLGSIGFRCVGVELEFQATIGFPNDHWIKLVKPVVIEWWNEHLAEQTKKDLLS